jgi:molecular chaperone GrpE
VNGLSILGGWCRQASDWLQRLAGAQAQLAPQPSAAPADVQPSAPVALPPLPALDLAGLEKQIAKLGREQFKANALLETQQQQLQAALEQLRERVEHSEKERAELLARRPTELAEARLQVAQRLLPVLDGLNEAMAAGERLLERAPSLIQLQKVDEPAGTRLPAWVNWATWPLVLVSLIFPGQVRERKRDRQQTITKLAADMAAWEDAQIAWLRGLELVRERLLQTLALEGVEPIETAGQPFDPHRHMALDAVPASPEFPPGMIVTELRRGYVAGARVLRYAEVIVARNLKPVLSEGTGPEIQTGKE